MGVRALYIKRAYIVFTCVHPKTESKFYMYGVETTIQ